MTLNVSLFASATDTTPQLRVGLSFAGLCDLLGPPKSYLAKEAAPLYSPAEWLPGKTRGKDGIAAIHFGVIDLDHCAPDDLVDIIVAVHRRGLAYYAATTWRHGEKSDKDACARLLVPFSRPVLVSEWPRFWQAFNDDVAQGRADDQCKDASRSYFFPSFCEGRHLEPFSDATAKARSSTSMRSSRPPPGSLRSPTFRLSAQQARCSHARLCGRSGRSWRDRETTTPRTWASRSDASFEARPLRENLGR